MLKPKLAILIPTIDGREHYFDKLYRKIAEQKMWFPDNDVVIIFQKDQGHLNGGMSIGEKRNHLIDYAVKSEATHRAFIDDDDDISDNYLQLNMPGVYGNYDCNSLVGIITTNGVKDPNKHIFFHSLKYDKWWEDSQYYYRNPNHLNVVSLEKTKDIRFPFINDGEDGQFSLELARRNCLHNEYEITEPFYYYLFRSKGLDGL